MALSIATYTLNAVSIGTTEWSLTTNTSGPDSDTTDGVYEVHIAVPAAATQADLFQVSVYETINGTQYKYNSFTIRGTAAAFLWQLLGVSLGVGWDVTIKKLTGTDRTFSAHINKAS
jgi:hypothetical protein